MHDKAEHPKWRDDEANSKTDPNHHLAIPTNEPRPSNGELPKVLRWYGRSIGLPKSRFFYEDYGKSHANEFARTAFRIKYWYDAFITQKWNFVRYKVDYDIQATYWMITR